MQIILLFLCIFAGFLIFLPQTPVPVVYHRPLKRGEIRKQAKTLISSRFKDSGQTGYK